MTSFTPWLEPAFALPTREDLEPKLPAGAALFGVGWGLVGLSPGPAVCGLLQGRGEVYVFVASMLAGMGVYRLVTAANAKPVDPEPIGGSR